MRRREHAPLLAAGSADATLTIPYSDPEGRPPKRYDPNNPEGGISWGMLAAGIVIPSTSIGTITKYENEAKTGIEALGNVLEAAKNYGGEEVIDFTDE